MAIVTAGIDLARNLFAVHGADEVGKPARVTLTDADNPYVKAAAINAKKPSCEGLSQSRKTVIQPRIR